VNPLAEEQVAEMEARLGEAQKNRDDLREAVKRLRATMAEFDREARERLTDAFVRIDGHFRDLFERLFGGGHAHLSLSGTDDPLTAGLEIYGCPPGKRLQTLSLMSGGEQALTALALVFAAFMVKPAPVCVLDEVDAPLDDANVDRLCSLVADMARGDATRFLVVTHHALTMARADRLVGVTMAERGVSKLVAIDLEAAAAYGH
jgi:chromosome segregation protein